MIKLVCCLVLSAVALFADVTGKWSGTGKGASPNGDQVINVSLDLKQDGNAVTGTVGSGESGDRYTINGGTIEGDVITFKVTPEDVTYEVKLNVKDDKMTGEATVNHGEQKMTIKLELKRDS